MADEAVPLAESVAADPNVLVAEACDEIERLRLVVHRLKAALMATGVPLGTVERIAHYDEADHER